MAIEGLVVLCIGTRKRYSADRRMIKDLMFHDLRPPYNVKHSRLGVISGTVGNKEVELNDVHVKALRGKK